MKALLTTYSSVNWSQFVSALGGSDVIKLSLKTDEVLSPIQSIANLDQLLNQSADAQLYVAIVQAEYFLAEAIDKQENLAAAAKQWQEQTQALLDFQRHHRRQLQLFNLNQALIYPDVFIEKINYSSAITKSPKPAHSSEMSLLAACQYVDQHTELQSLNTRLLAITLPLSDEDKPQVDIESVLQHEKIKQQELLNLQQKIDGLQTELNTAIQKQQSISSQSDELLLKTKKESDLLLSQLHIVQEQLESQVNLHAELRAVTNKAQNELQEAYNASQINLQKLQAESAGLQKESSHLKDELNKLKTENTAIADERDLILAQLHQVQEKVEEYYLALQAEEQKNKHSSLARDKQYAKEIQKLENELRKANARAASAEYSLGLLHQELAEHRNSRLWKATSPVRLLGSLVKRVDRSKEKLQQDIGLLLTSEYFDVEWYLRHYPDVAESKMNPAEHYLLYGAAEGRLPGPLFDGNWYLQQYPDVAEAGTNPLLHFITYGLQEGRNSSPKYLMNNQTNEDLQ